MPTPTPTSEDRRWSLIWALKTDCDALAELGLSPSSVGAIAAAVCVTLRGNRPASLITRIWSEEALRVTMPA